MENKPANLLVASLGKALIPSFGVVDRWPVIPKRARYSAFS